MKGLKVIANNVFIQTSNLLRSGQTEENQVVKFLTWSDIFSSQKWLDFLATINPNNPVVILHSRWSPLNLKETENKVYCECNGYSKLKGPKTRP
jgi:hypothetical protein